MVATVTAIFCWGPNDGWDLTPKQIQWWYDHGIAIEKARR